MRRKDRRLMSNCLCKAKGGWRVVEITDHNAPDTYGGVAVILQPVGTVDPIKPEEVLIATDGAKWQP